jgi:RNA polymerase sigma factor (sigma-70 family)
MPHNGGGVPADFDDFVERYAKLVLWAIQRISRGRVRPEDVPDLVQLVYLRVWEKNYIERCRFLIAERGTGQFSTFLYWLVRSVLINEFRANARSPLNYSFHLLDPRETRADARRRPHTVVIDKTPTLLAASTDIDFETRLQADLLMERFARHVAGATKRGERIARTLQMVLEGRTTPEITEATGLTRSQIVQDRRDLRAEYAAFVRRVG